MKYIRQIAIILFISFLGEVLNFLIPLPIPGSIYGIMLMLAGLLSGIIPLDSVREVSRFLIDIMPIFFVAPAVGLMEAWGLVSHSAVKYITLLVVCTVFTMGISGQVTQLIIRRSGKSGASVDGGDVQTMSQEAERSDTPAASHTEKEVHHA